MNSITIGQYIPGNSWLHRLDPRVKLLSLTVILVSIFLIPITAQITPVIIMGCIFMGILFLAISSGISLMKLINGLRPIVFLLTFTFVIQIFYIRTGNLLFDPLLMNISIASVSAIVFLFIFYNWSKKYVKTRILYFFFVVFLVFVLKYFLPYINLTSYTLYIYDHGVIRAGFIFVRIANVIILTSLLTFTTMTTDLNYGIESLLKPLKIIKVPVDMIAMMLSLTLRYIPTLLGETQKIMKAQTSRGVDFKESKFKDKVLQIVALLVPVFVISFKRAEDLANAMEVRGYVIDEKRTRIDQYSIGTTDVISLIVSILILSGIIYSRIAL